MTFLNYFVKLDSFGVGINFYLKWFWDYRSHLGGFVTLVIYITTIICGIIFSKGLFTKTNPTVSTSTMNNPNPVNISYPSETFFILGLTVDSLPFVDEKIYRPMAYILKKSNESEVLSRNLINLNLLMNNNQKTYHAY